MRGKRAKQLRKAARLITADQPEEFKEIYKTFKRMYKNREAASNEFDNIAE